MDDSEDVTLEHGIQVGTALDHFVEVDEVKQLIKNIPLIVNDQAKHEMSDEKFTEIVDKYLEQPHLLDPHLLGLLEQLIAFIQPLDVPLNQKHCAFKYLYLLTKVRGHKIMVRYFPHEVQHLEPILKLLYEQKYNDLNTWETRYMLLLWLSMICLIPFDMVRFDLPHTGDASHSQTSVTQRIMDIGKLYLITSSDNCQEAAALLLSKFLTRPDVMKTHLKPFFEWCIDKITNSDAQAMHGVTQIKGCLFALALVFKQGKRDDVLPFCTEVLDEIQRTEILSVKNTVLRKLVIKLTQRLGMTLLKPRLASWRYQRGNRSLDETLKKNDSTPSETVTICDASDEDDEYDVPEEVETVIEVVLNGLKDKDTVVRWSSAKGVGRITGRLPKELADEVVQSVLENFTISNSDGAWHGGCLALAELGRRGLLLPTRLKDVVPILLRSLTYDERRGASSVGAHVRDAACYLAWSFARAYEPQELSAHVNDIAQTLLVTTVFDREVNCRRAASAAFQENVGRQGYFPHGIKILTMADYFAVSNRNNTYLKIGPFIGQYKTYTKALIEHLTKQKRDHWDSNIRWLAAQSMHKLTKSKPDYVAATVLPELVPLCTGMDLITRHGSILIVAEVIHSLHEIEEAGSTGLLSRNPMVKKCFRIVQSLSEAKLFRGFGGELMRVAACHLIARLSQCTATVTIPRLTNDGWLELIHETLSNLHTYTNTEEICTTAISALSAINQITLIPAPFANLSTNNESMEGAVDQYLSHLRSTSERQRCGYAQAIASLPKPVLQTCFMKVCHNLIRASQITDKFETSFAESRKEAVNALSRVCQSVGINNIMDAGICKDNINTIYDAIFFALEDYTRDHRGDIGSVVRLAGVKALQVITQLIAKEDKDLLCSKLMLKIMCCILQQACEKIHKVRDIAAATLLSVIYDDNIPNIPVREQLRKVFDTRNPTFTMIDLFCRLIKLLKLPEYAYHITLGFVISVGDLTQSLAEASGSALFAYIETISKNPEELLNFCSNLLKVFENYSKQDRVSVPLLKTLHQLLVQDGLEILFKGEHCKLDDEGIQRKLFSLVKSEITKSKDPQKIMLGVQVYCGLLQFSDPVLHKSVLSQLMIMLCQKFPIVRRTTATQLYEVILTFDDILDQPEHLDDVMESLSEVEWDQTVEELRPIRNKLCAYFGVKVPQMIKKTKTSDA
uniref:tubulin-specific chaperone D-like n=1 Tax=Ciona intestinalis TaxID=7719 RepID=UPI000180BE9C|nr:tubulin-specific chaperone D-like [Ciona intestinalis]XP_018668800.1 tubulin-specific chaperone D-like [Ciona intestinalis]|eukprot:XP_009859600.1 tubulin-specific chaperone D-like [Ciona intestinalis]